MNERAHFTGNAAKSAIAEAVAALAAARGGRLTVFDFGCGAGSDWPAFLAAHPGIAYIGFDPSTRSLAKARTRFAGLEARLLDAAQLAATPFTADAIVSFSVFEHVYDRPAYLAEAKRRLAPDGTFFLNYDDGHFRNQVDASRPSTWRSGAGAAWRHLRAGPLAKLGFRNDYLRRVPRAESERLAVAAGFAIERSWYANLADLKLLAKSVPPEREEEFVRWWRQVEDDLNQRFAAPTGSLVPGDTASLWSAMTSLNLVLRHG